MQQSSPQSHLQYPLTAALGSSGNVRILRRLALHGGALGAAQLAEESGLTPAGARRAIGGLVGQGVLTAMGRARTTLFALSRGHPLTEALVALFEAERHQWESLSRQLRGVLANFDTVKAAWLYGSAARGEDRAGSDVDIAIAVEGDVEQTADAVRAAMHPIEDRYRTAVSVVALAPGDILARVNDPWWSDVVRDARVLKAIAPQRYVAQLERAGAPR